MLFLEIFSSMFVWYNFESTSILFNFNCMPCPTQSSRSNRSTASVNVRIKKFLISKITSLPILLNGQHCTEFVWIFVLGSYFYVVLACAIPVRWEKLWSYHVFLHVNNHRYKNSKVSSSKTHRNRRFNIKFMSSLVIRIWGSYQFQQIPHTSHIGNYFSKIHSNILHPYIPGSF